VLDVRQDRSRNRQHRNGLISVGSLEYCDGLVDEVTDNHNSDPGVINNSQHTMVHRTRLKCLKRLTSKDEPLTPSTKKHCSDLYQRIVKKDPLVLSALDDFENTGVTCSQEMVDNMKLIMPSQTG
jgi:hypothetical protein